MGKSPQELYQERLKRFNDAVSLQIPDRVPIVSLANYFVFRYAGLTNKDVLYDPERAAAAFKESTIRLNWDMSPRPGSVMNPGRVWEMVGYTMHKWPGCDLPDNSPHQFVEAEYMSADEYDEFLRDPGDFTVRKLLPRISTALAPLAKLPPLHQTFPQFWTVLPSLAEALQTMADAAAEYEKSHAIRTKLVKDLEEAGFPVLSLVTAMAPFDKISDLYRGLRGSMLDMYRCPDKLLAAIDFFTDVEIETTVAAARRVGNPRIFIPLHRGAGGFMSNEQFARFYWPSLKKLLLGLIDAGLTPMPWFEGDYTPRLEFLAELPGGKVAGHFDVVDLKKCKEILGDTLCFWGNVPASILVTGTPRQVEDYVLKLIDIFGDNGGLIVDGAVSGVPDESKPENVEAMTEAVFKHGVYRKS